MVWEQRVHQVNYAYANSLQCHTQCFPKWFLYENLAAAWQNEHNDLCAQRRLRSALASAQSDQSLRCPPEAIVGPKLSIERTAKTLIRLGGCPGCNFDRDISSSLRWAQLSSWGGSKCFFLESKYAGHIHFITFCFTFRIDRGSYTRGHFTWNLWNEPSASFINFIWNDHVCVRFCLPYDRFKDVRWLQLFIQTFFLTSLFRFTNI